MKNVLILILFLLIIIAALLVVLIAKREPQKILHKEEHWYYIVFVCEKFTWCEPEVQAAFWHGTPDQLAIWLEGKHVESITKLD